MIWFFYYGPAIVSLCLLFGLFLFGDEPLKLPKNKAIYLLLLGAVIPILNIPLMCVLFYTLLEFLAYRDR